VPADLDDLCAALLSRDPEARPGGDEVLRRLHAASTPAPSVRREPFVGRAREKAELSRLFSASTSGQCQVVLARGPSGIGKSALFRCFLEELRQRQPTPVVLFGRCFEMESIP